MLKRKPNERCKIGKRSGISVQDLELASKVSSNIIIVTTYKPTKNENGTAEIISKKAAVAQ